jgi:copper(I)-binding protein
MRGVPLAIAGVSLVTTTLMTGCSTRSSESSAAMTARMDGANATAGALSISRAYIPQPASPDVGVLYFTASNSGATPITLTGVSLDGAASAGFDQYVNAVGGGQEMTALDSVVVPPHGKIELSPGHDHIMLEGPRSLHQGDTTNVTIEIADAEPLHLAVPVVAITGLENMPGMKMGS